MNERRDPLLESLFDAADEALEGKAFESSVEHAVRARRRRVMLGRVTVGALLVMLELLLDSPLQSSLGVTGDALSTSLLPIDHEWVAFILMPVNTVAGLVGLLLVGLHYFYRKITH
jgi:hypothetical protein